MFGRRGSWALTREGHARGWEALESALGQYGLGEAMHFPTGLRTHREGAYAINAVRDDGVWTLMTWGLSELFDKTETNGRVSGWGAEITMRVASGPSQDEPPVWARLLLESLAQMVAQRQRAFEPGERLDLGAPVDGHRKCRQQALAFAADPVVPTIGTPHGSVAFVTAVGITPEEVGQMMASSPQAVLEALRSSNPLLVTDTRRG